MQTGGRGRRQLEPRARASLSSPCTYHSGALRRSTRRASARRRTGSDRRPMAGRGRATPGPLSGGQLQPAARRAAPVNVGLRARSHFRFRRPSRLRACALQPPPPRTTSAHARSKGGVTEAELEAGFRPQCRASKSRGNDPPPLWLVAGSEKAPTRRLLESEKGDKLGQVSGKRRRQTKRGCPGILKVLLLTGSDRSECPWSGFWK